MTTKEQYDKYTSDNDFRYAICVNFENLDNSPLVDMEATRTMRESLGLPEDGLCGTFTDADGTRCPIRVWAIPLTEKQRAWAANWKHRDSVGPYLTATRAAQTQRS